MTTHKILLTGATGYVGGRLLKELKAQGRDVRCLARVPGHVVAEQCEVIKGDVLDVDSLKDAMAQVHTAFYMIHSMGSDDDFNVLDRIGAENFGRIASESGVKKIIYLGALADESIELSPHLKSRHEVGRILRETAKGVVVIEFRASIVLGSGSLSFEMIRALSERLPFMITPKWVWTPSQPIGINDLLQYLIQAIDLQLDKSEIFEIGGADVVTYGGLMREYCKQRHLKRFMLAVPVLTPKLSSLWLGLVTPLYARVGRKLIDSACYPTVIRDHKSDKYFKVNPIGYSEAIAIALRNEDKEFAETRWTDAISSASTIKNWAGVTFRNREVDTKEVQVPVSAERAFAPIRRIGGATGWYYANLLWKLRGALDTLIGGVGLRRSRRDSDQLREGDILDFWRVEEYIPNHLLRLRAEMKMPGRAWLQFEVVEKEGVSTIRQTAIFDPVGIGGLLYWYGLYPIHHFIFSGMLRGIAKEAIES